MFKGFINVIMNLKHNGMGFHSTIRYSKLVSETVSSSKCKESTQKQGESVCINHTYLPQFD